MYYFESLKKSLSTPNLTDEQLKTLMEETEFFFKVLKVKLESKDPELHDQAAQELRQLRTFLEKR